MKVYNYDRASGAFIGESDADPSPMEPGKFLVPAFATTTKPPADDGNKMPIFDSTKNRWKMVERIIEPPAAPPAPAAADVIEAMRNVVRGYLHSCALALDFDSLDEALTYVDEPAVPKYQMQARALRAHRSLVWSAFDVVLAEMRSNLPPPADAEALIARLPQFVAPNTAELESFRAKDEGIPDSLQPQPE